MEENKSIRRVSHAGPAGCGVPGTRALELAGASQITSQKVRLIRVLAVAPTVGKNGTDKSVEKKKQQLARGRVRVLCGVKS